MMNMLKIADLEIGRDCVLDGTLVTVTKAYKNGKRQIQADGRKKNVPGDTLVSLEVKGGKTVNLIAPFRMYDSRGVEVFYGDSTSRSLIPCDQPVEGTPFQDAELVHASGMIIPNLRKFGHVTRKELVSFKLENGVRVKTDPRQFLDADGLAQAVQARMVDEARGQLFDPYRVVGAAQKALVSKVQGILTERKGLVERAFAFGHSGLSNTEVGISKKQAKRLARRFHVASVEGLRVLVIGYPVTGGNCALWMTLRIVPSNARCIFLNEVVLKLMGRDCDGDQLTITVKIHGEPLCEYGPFSDLSKGGIFAPSFFNRGQLSLKTVTASPSPSPVAIAYGAASKGAFTGRVYNTFETLAILAALKLPTVEARQAFCGNFGLVGTEADLSVNWVSFITKSVKESQDTFTEIGMDFGKQVEHKVGSAKWIEMEGDNEALWELIEIAEGTRRYLSPAVQEKVEKAGRRVNYRLINGIMSMIPHGETVTTELRHYPISNMLLGTLRDQDVANVVNILGSMYRQGKLGVQYMVDVFNGDVTETRIPWKPRVRDQEWGDRVVYGHGERPSLFSLLSSTPVRKGESKTQHHTRVAWLYIESMVNWLNPGGNVRIFADAKKGRFDPIGARIAGVHVKLEPTQFTFTIPGDDKAAGYISLQSRTGSIRIAPHIIRCANRGIAGMRVQSDRDTLNAINDKDLSLQTILDVMAEDLFLVAREQEIGTEPVSDSLFNDLVNESLGRVIESNSFGRYTHNEEKVDGKISLYHQEIRCEDISYGTARGSMLLLRRKLELMDSGVFVNPLNPDVTHRLDVGVTSKNAPGSVAMIVPEGESCPSIVSAVNTVPGNRKRESLQARTASCACEPLNASPITFFNGKEGLQTQIIRRAVEAVIVAVSAPEWLTMFNESLDTVENADKGYITPRGMRTFARNRKRAIKTGLTRAQADSYASELYEADVNTDDLIRLGWEVSEDEGRRTGRYDGETMFEVTYTLKSPDIKSQPSLHKVSGIGGHRFVGIETEQDYVINVGGTMVYVDAFVAEETVLDKKLGNAVVAGLGALLGRTDFSGDDVDFESLKSDVETRLWDNNMPMDGQLGLGRVEGDNVVFCGYGFPGLYRTFLCREDEEVSSRSSGNGCSSTALFRRQVGREYGQVAIGRRDRTHLASLIKLSCFEK